MRSVSAHIAMLILAAVLARLGWLMAHNPVKALHLFTFGADPTFWKSFWLGCCKVIGWIFAWGFGLGVPVYLILVLIDLTSR